MNSVVLDASAVLALLLDERGADQVDGERDRAAISAVNAGEVIERLVALGRPAEDAVRTVEALELDIVDFTFDLAAIAARLRTKTRAVGLSLGDRACLALALREGLPALTADRGWSKVDVGIEVRLIR